jgi:predicted enzyme related to lactoylglutathione lyase
MDASIEGRALVATRDHAPKGAPCWTDLWTSDVEGSRAFYSALFGWEALEPSEEFGGYFMFARDGVPTAGGMGEMGDATPDNRWRVYFHTDDAERAAKSASAAGASVVGGSAMPVADLGVQFVASDPYGAPFGAWQPGTFHGFSVLSEHGAPSWFELHTSDYQRSIDFYSSVFEWQVASIGDTDEFRYSVVLDPEFNGELAGIMDMPDATSPAWSVYWHVDDVPTALEDVRKLGGKVLDVSAETPYGVLATASDPAGAPFKLRATTTP